MNFLDKMERKFGRYAISNLSIYIIITYAAGYLLQLWRRMWSVIWFWNRL